MGQEPQFCLAFEDSRVGIQSAVAAGLPTVAMSGLIPEELQRSQGAIAVIDNFNQWLKQS